MDKATQIFVVVENLPDTKTDTMTPNQMGLAVGTEKGIAKNLSSMAHHMFKKDITWFKVASFYNLVSAAAVDCVRQGHPEYLYGIVEAAGLVIERDVANWIANQGGWVGVIRGYNIQLSFSIGTGPEWKNGYSGLVPNGKKAIRDWCLSPIFLY